MNLPILISICATFLFGIIAIVSSFSEQKSKKLLLEREEKQKHRLYEIAILKEIQDRIGYSLDIEKVIDVITGSLRNLFPYSTASSIIIKDEKLIFTCYVEEAISRNFIKEVKQGMLKSLEALLNEPLAEKSFEENLAGVALDEENALPLSSFFHIPLIVNDKIIGLISVSSTKPHLYKEEEMTILYQITNEASRALSRLQDVLATEKGKLMSMISSLVDGVFMVDINSDLIVINYAAKKFLNIFKDKPTIIDVLSSLPSTYDFGGRIQKAIALNQPFEEKEVKFGDKFFQIFITPVIDTRDNGTDKKVIGASVLLHNITLEKSIAQMKEDFTNIIVHELRSPLTSIKASTEFLMWQNEKLSKEERTNLIQLIKLQADKLLEEIALILDAAKLEAGLFTIHKIPGDFKKLITERLEIFKPQAQSKGISFQTEIDPNLPICSFDPQHMGQVVNNLISNSLKFTPNNGIITIKARQDGNRLEIIVIDNGVGIPKEKQSKLFSKFTQIAHPNATVGTGLGLYIVKGIIEAHGGTVKLESEPGQGTTITLTIPIVLPLSQVPISNSPSVPVLHLASQQETAPIVNNPSAAQIPATA